MIKKSKIKHFLKLEYFFILMIFLLIFLKIFYLAYTDVGLNEAGYGAIAKQVLEGKKYLTFFDHKPILTHYTPLAIFMVFGPTLFSLRLLAFILFLAIIIFTFFITKKEYSLNYAFLATVLVATLFFPYGYENDVPMAIFGLLAVFFYSQYFQNNKKLSLVLSGLFIAISIWFKQPGFFYFLAIFIHQSIKVYNKKLKIKKSMIEIGYILLGVFLISIPLLIYSVYLLGLEKFIYVIFIFNTKFSGSVSRIFQIGNLAKSLAYMWPLFALIFINPKILKKNIFNYVSAIVIIVTIPFLFLSPEISMGNLLQIIPFIVIISVSSLENLKSKDLKKIGYIILIGFFLFSFIENLEISSRAYKENSLGKQLLAVEFMKENLSKNVFASDPQYYFLADIDCDYKVCFLAPSSASVFDFSDFCDYIKSKDYLVLTHRKKYLSEDNLKCIDKNFILIKKYEDVGESFVEIWKNNVE